jgi:hypothetical protein
MERRNTRRWRRKARLISLHNDCDVSGPARCTHLGMADQEIRQSSQREMLDRMFSQRFRYSSPLTLRSHTRYTQPDMARYGLETEDM